jgi:hypothetical protein
MRGQHTKIIWRTVVFAGAMLGAPACGGKDKPASTTPSNDTTTENATTTDTATQPDPANPCNPCAANPCNPCGDRPRGGDDEEGGMGRGFILS